MATPCNSEPEMIDGGLAGRCNQMIAPQRGEVDLAQALSGREEREEKGGRGRLMMMFITISARDSKAQRYKREREKGGFY